MAKTLIDHNKGLKELTLTCLILLFLVIPCLNTYANSSVIEVPAGRSIDVVLDVGLNSSTNQPGDIVITHLNKGFYNNSEYILPPGSKIEGKITYLKHAGLQNQNAEMKVLFTNIITPYGHKLPISAVIETKEGRGILVGSGKSAFKKFGSAFANIGKRTALTTAERTAMKAITPKNIRKAIVYTATGAIGVDIIKDVKTGKKQAAAIKTAEQVVKYTPYGQTYKYGKNVYKGIKDAKKSASNPDGYGFNIDIKQGSHLELILLKPLTIKPPIK